MWFLPDTTCTIISVFLWNGPTRVGCVSTDVSPLPSSLINPCMGCCVDPARACSLALSWFMMSEKPSPVVVASPSIMFDKHMTTYSSLVDHGTTNIVNVSSCFIRGCSISLPRVGTARFFSASPPAMPRKFVLPHA